MSQAVPMIGVDALGILAVRGNVDSGEFRLLGPGGIVKGVLPVAFTGGVMQVNLFPLLAGKQPGGYAIQSVTYKDGSATLGTIMTVNYDPVAVSTGAMSEPSCVQMSILPWGGFTGLEIAPAAPSE